MALAESQSLGRPVVASRIGGMPEVVQDGITGRIVPPGNSVALAQVLEVLLEDPALRARYGAMGAAEARRRFAPHVFRRSVADVFDAVMLRTPGATASIKSTFDSKKRELPVGAGGDLREHRGSPTTTR
jgi:glycosyltransferase involved in cell wall biosynthesis